MKNSKNKIIAAVICGMVVGSVGTSIVGNFQTKNSVTTASADKSVNNTQSSGSSSNNTQSNSSSSNNNNNTSNGEHENGYKGGKGKGGGRHQGAASLDSTESVDVASGSYNDGTYEGTADGFAKNLSVSVDISGGKITSVNITNHNETPGFYEKAFEMVPQEIVSSQSTNVDTASGATYSSVGIINAVNNALSSASK